MNLVIDIGNSRTKAAVFEKSDMVEDFVVTGSSDKCLENIFKMFPALKNTIVSSVKDTDESYSLLLKNNTKGLFIKLDSSTPVPVKLLYKTPETLGKDRLAAVVGAHNLYKSSHILVIDAGTAITFDFINSKGEYTGGNISPGMEMRYKALHQFTDRLPKLRKSEDYPETGNDTKTAIISGVSKGILYEIEGYISMFLKDFNDLKIIITGGDADFFVKKLKKTIFVIPNLTLIGLNNILQYNEKTI